MPEICCGYRNHGGCYRPTGSPAAQAATERHSRNLPPAVDPAETPLSRYAFSILQVGVVPVTAGPGDEKAARAVGGGHLRASYADRDHVIDTLKAAFVQGRLTKDELDLRVGQTFAARTYGELAALTADLPTGLTGARSPGRATRAQTRRPVRAAKAAAGAGLALALLAAAVFSGPGNGPERLIFLAVFFIPACGLLLGGLLMLHSRLEKRSQRGQLPPSPKQGGLAVEGEHNGAPGDDRILCEARRDVRTRHLPRHGVFHRICRPLQVSRHQHRPGHLPAAA